MHMKEEQLFYWILLNSISTISFQQFTSLVSFFENDLKKVFSSSENELKQIVHMTSFLLSKILEIKNDSKKCLWVDQEIAHIQKEKINLIAYIDDDYPFLLKQIFNLPPLLYVKGKIPKTKLFLAVVGTRNATPYGLEITDRLCQALAKQDVTIVSGLARGIDTCAHEAVLKVKGYTVGILGHGLNFVYPKNNKKLYEQIENMGTLISEFPLKMPPLAHNFPRRNRIISGMCQGVIVTQASQKSGSLITARLALEEGREVFAVPGSLGAKGSQGTHFLIQQGAKLITDTKDILEEFSIQSPLRSNGLGTKEALTLEQKNLHSLNKEEEKILMLLDDAKNFDELLCQSHFDASALSSILFSFELKGWIQNHQSRYYRRIEWQNNS